MVLSHIPGSRIRHEDERGAVAILVAVLVMVLFIIAAMVVDLGLARDTKRQSQNAADASALAAGNKLYTAAGTLDLNSAVSEAKDYALTNFDVPLTAWSTCADANQLAVPSSSTDCISFDHATKPTRIRVKVPLRDVKTGLGAVAGVQNISIDSDARAALTPAIRVECSLCVLGSTVHYVGNGDVSVITVTGGGGIHMNGSLSGQNNSNWTAPSGITIEGTWDADPNYSPPPTSGPRIEDPFINKALPTDFSTLGAPKTNPCTDGPGIYNVAYEVSGTCTFSPGLYVFTNKLHLKNNGNLLGTGVSLYFPCVTGTTPRACSAGGELGGEFDAKNGEVKITAGASPISNFVVAYDRNNTRPISLQGNGNSVLTGDVYAVRSLLDANGNSCHTVQSGSIIVNDIYLNGNPSCLKVQNGNPAVYIRPPSDLHLDQ
jgi:hypothetical protein